MSILAEIITIGDELMTGHTVDSNSAFISQHLTSIGISVAFKSSIGDSVDAMEAAFHLALKRARIIITTGGLGPTDDDLTKRALVKLFKRNLIFHEDILEDIRNRYSARGIEMPAINQNQALLPQGATFFPNKYGSAVGICIPDEGRLLISLPGVPQEMRQMMTDEVIPYLKNLKGLTAIEIRKIRTTGIVESRLAELIGASYKAEQQVKLAYLPDLKGVDLRIIASDNDKEVAREKADAAMIMLEKAIGKYVYGRDNDTLPEVVGQLLIDNDRTLSVAESCTGGQLGMLVTSVSGSSRYFIGGALAYSNRVKTAQLGVAQATLDNHGSVSEECAIEMASGARKIFQSDYALAITGVAGPEGGTDDKPVGTVWIALASSHGSKAKKFNFGRDRESNRSRASFAALEMLRRDILDIS